MVKAANARTYMFARFPVDFDSHTLGPFLYNRVQVPLLIPVLFLLKDI